MSLSSCGIGPGEHARVGERHQGDGAASDQHWDDIGVGDPGDWSRYTATSGASVNLISIGNAPSAILNVLVGGGGSTTYDVINIVGGMQKPLVENDLVLPIDATKLPNWGKNSYILEFLKPGSPGFNFIGYKEKVYVEGASRVQWSEWTTMQIVLEDVPESERREPVIPASH